eukprot:CAMPEP_0194136240 /NCGR_PEP_ID=MMETSP0152-20130528/6260_1 /TAXON_ID=1049557 /ORGANISM="Thalassiothrix antarctica, Strain L6-D1" /LENGTH=217 /DNA_ID=CAMNT_0038832811 /DNA_START=15 /DNA_END=668 /DNA_ORIENTATION=-
MSDNNDGLNAFLRERLPKLGLDYDTYGSYVVGLFDDDDDDADWDGILELLQASSDTHSDNDVVWKEFQNDVVQLQEKSTLLLKEKEEKLRNERIKEEKERLQEEIAFIKEQKEQTSSEEKKELDASKQALMARFEYDESELYDNDGNHVSSTSTTDEKVVTNKEHALQANQEKAKELRANSNYSKKDEQAKTAKAKQSKALQKEERRNRSHKGERKR